jgi:hypothetical protein
MAKRKKTIELQPGITISTDNWQFQRFALEVARMTRDHIDEINAGLAEQKKQKRREARERRKAALAAGQ